MPETIQLQTGQSVEIYERHDMWRADLNGVHYCGDSRNTVLEALKHLNPTLTPQKAEPLSILTPLEKLTEVINSAGSLESKQDAWTRLKTLAGTDQDAKYIVDIVSSRPISLAAQEITRTIGKKDFMDVTYAELAKYVSNLVVRSYLVAELSKRFII